MPSIPDTHDESGPRHGRKLRRFGVAMFVAGVVAGFALRLAELDSHLVWLSILPIVLILCGAFMLYRGKQLAAAAQSDAAGTVMEDKPPVVYLRPFAADESGWGQVFSSLLTAKMFSAVLSEEEQLAEAVAPIGPLVAIGEPGESLPKPGAARVYPARWRESVEDLLRRARLVILRPGKSEGVRWEFEQTFKTVDREKIVLLLKRMNSKDYEQLRTTIAQTCGIELPAFHDVRRGRKVHAFVEFGSSGSPRVLPIKGAYLRGSVRKPMVAVFKYTLFPVFQRLGVRWQPSPVSTARVAAVSVLGMLANAFVIGGLLMLVGSGIDAYSSHASDAALIPTTPTDASPAEHGVAADGSPEPQIIAGLQIAASGVSQPADLGIARRDSIESSESYLCRDGRRHVVVTRVDFKAGVSISIDGASKGALAGSAAAGGVTDFRATTMESTVSGLRAIRTSASFTLSGETWIDEGVVFAAGETLWNVQAYGPQREDSGAAVRAIHSIAIPQGTATDL